VTRLLDENKRLARRQRSLAELAATAEAQAMLQSTPVTSGQRLVSQLFDDRDVDELKLLAHRLVAHPGVIALLATRTPAMARLVFARSADLAVAMHTLLTTACTALGGRGGGTPELAQGGGPHVAALEQVMAEAVAALTQSISQRRPV
jgi:alanyl-tRNA synthetase